MKPYYQDDAVTIYHGDCAEVLGVCPKVDLVFTSPPYNLGTTTGGGFPGIGNYARGAALGARGGGGKSWGKWSGGSLANGYGIHDDAMPPAEYEAWQRGVLSALWAQLSDVGAIYYNHKPRVQAGEAWLPLTLNPGLPLRQIVTWARSGGLNFAPTHYVPTYEWVMIFAKEGFRLRDKSASGLGDVWHITQESAIDHPAPFPLQLALNAISTTSAAAVLDPFAGSGTTLRAAKDLGRKAIGIEIEERYCEIAARRCAQEVLDLGALTNARQALPTPIEAVSTSRRAPLREPQ